MDICVDSPKRWKKFAGRGLIGLAVPSDRADRCKFIEIFRQVADAMPADSPQRLDVLFRMAQAMPTAEAVAVYLEVLEVDSRHPNARAELIADYRELHRWEQLAGQLELAANDKGCPPAKRKALLMECAELYEHRLDRPEDAVRVRWSAGGGCRRLFLRAAVLCMLFGLPLLASVLATLW